MLREFAPFFIGMILPPLVMLAVRASWSGSRKFALAVAPALVLGFFTSMLAGELAGGIPEGVMAIIIDTSLVFTGSQLAYRLFWKRSLEARLIQRDIVPAPQRIQR